MLGDTDKNCKLREEKGWMDVGREGGREEGRKGGREGGREKIMYYQLRETAPSPSQHTPETGSKE